MRIFRDINWKRLDYISITIMTLLLMVGIYCLRQEDLVSGGTSGLYKKQLFGVAVGLVVFVVAILIDYRTICRNAYVLYGGIVLILAYTLAFAEPINNVKRWVKIAGIQLQPSELAKTVLILFIAFLCEYFYEEMYRYKTFFILCAAVGLPLVLIVLEPHLSSTLVIVFVFGVMLLMSGMSYKIIGKVAAVVVPAVVALVIAVGVFDVKVPFIQQYQVKRVLSFLSDDKEEDMQGKYQQNQALTAIASGGKNGKIVDDEGSSVRAFGAIYANESDFVFSIVGEEFGFIGCTIILLLYFILVTRCLYIGINAPDYMGQMICIGISAMLMFQTFANVGVATSILPNTGLPLPFISYGLTSLVNSFAAVAVVVNVGLRSR